MDVGELSPGRVRALTDWLDRHPWLTALLLVLAVALVLPACDRGATPDRAPAQKTQEADRKGPAVPLGDLDPVVAAPLTDAGATSHHAVARAVARLGEGTTAVVIGAATSGFTAIRAASSRVSSTWVSMSAPTLDRPPAPPNRSPKMSEKAENTSLTSRKPPNPPRCRPS